MSGLRERPLTWLFFAAAACLNAVACARSTRVEWFDDLVAGQLVVAGGWLASGRSHRLLRASIVVGAVLASTAPDYFALLRYGNEVWRSILGSIVCLTASAAVGAWCTMWLATRGRCTQDLGRTRSLSFPLVEIFGWTILVAVFALVMKSASFERLEGWRSLSAILGGGAVAGGIIVLLSGRVPGRNRLALVAAIALTAFWGASQWRYDASDDPSIGGAGLYVVLWLIVQRFDAESAIERPLVPGLDSRDGGLARSRPHERRFASLGQPSRLDA
jgi:hypothetical protein